MKAEISRRRVRSWGRIDDVGHRVGVPADATEAATLLGQPESSWLPFGLGRSYGDVCLNEGGGLIDARGLDRPIAFDAETGLLEVEGGVSLAEILSRVGRSGPGWFLPVSPGTKFVTVGGAIANDVHGKNHHRSGCFGNHVVSLRLLRSDGAVRTCSPTENADLFAATIGGLGLTGLIVSAVLRMMRVPSRWIEVEDIRFDDLAAFERLSASSASDWEYTVAWIDCFATGARSGRGIFTRARHAERDGPPPAASLRPRVSLRLDLPAFVLNRATVGIFNQLYWRKSPRKPERRTTSYEPVFYPLDAIGDWNRLYGSRGFYQFQCVVPAAAARDAIPLLLSTIGRSGQGSFLSVLKTFGSIRSPGLLSFPMPGTTLALDFPNRGPATRELLGRLHAITSAAGGRLYPAKDRLMSPSRFRDGYPRFAEFATHVDPRFSSSFWRRVGG